MLRKIFFLLLCMAGGGAWPDIPHHGLRVDVTREGRLYTFLASFETSLSKCAAFHYLTDYAAATNLPGVIESSAYRQSAHKVTVERTADEHVLFFSVRLHSVMEYTEKPFESVAFIQVKGDSKTFQGSWDIEPNRQGSIIRFRGLWEPDSLIPMFVIDHFAKNGLIDKFSAIAQLAEERKDSLPTSCVN